MGLRSYLIKRAAHTVVTIVIVLTLMFVLFRLMPGDPVSLLVQPGLTPFERDAQRVAFGFARWEVAPGVFKLGNFRIPDVGLYNVTINAEDTAGNRLELYAAYVQERPPAPGSPLFIHTVELNPGLHLFEGDTLTITANVIRSNASVPLSSLEVWALVSPPSGSPSNVTLSLSPENRFTGTFTPTGTGVFGMEIGAYNPVEGHLAAVPYGFAVNPAPADIAPFRYITDEDPRGPIFTTGVSWARDVVEVYAILGSTAGDVVERFNASVTWPSRGEYLTQEISMAHPLVAVPRPIYEEFWFYMVGILSGNFGTSFTSGRSVGTELSERIGPTLLLFGSATIIAIVLGILGGVLLAWIRGSRTELTAIVTSLFFYSMPIFWFGLILLFVFAYTYSLFPLGGFGCLDAQGLPLQGVDCALDVLWHMTLPLLNLVILNLAGYVLLMRNSLMEVLGEDFVQVARAKGLKERTVMYRHAARNAMLPVTTVVALAMAGVISGGVLTETIFSWPGMGFYLVQRTLTQDFPAVQAAFFVLALLTILGNVVADVAYAYLDPRVRL
jgi:peptide/nickel transport system permease protein